MCAGAALGFFVLTLAPPAHAQHEDRLIVQEVRFFGGGVFSDDQLRSLIRTSPNRRILGVDNLTWWLWIYELGESGVLGSAISRVLMQEGEPPAWLDETVLAGDIEQLRLYYERHGFRSATIEARVDTSDVGAEVTFNINPGRPTYIRRVTYAGLGSLDEVHRRQVTRESLLPAGEPGSVEYTAEDLRFSEPLLVEERHRLLSVLREVGYAAVTRDSIHAVVVPAIRDSFDVTLHVNTGPRIRFGTVHFEVEGPAQDMSVRSGSLPTGISWNIRNDDRLDWSLLTGTLQFNPGQWYDQSLLLATKRRLDDTGAFTFTDIQSMPSPAPTGLDHLITVRTRPRHRFRFETFTVQRSSVLGAAGSEFGAGLGTTYENASVFGSAESLRLQATGSVAADIDLAVFSSVQTEVVASLTLPYPMAPFTRAIHALRPDGIRTVLSLSLITARREDLRLAIRGRGTARVRMELRHTPTVASFIDLLDVSLSNPDTLRGFQDRFLRRILGADDTMVVDDPVQRARILEDYTQPQINNALRYTFRSAAVNPLRRERGYSYEAAFEIGGHLPYWLDAYVLTPDVTEGSLPGLAPLGGGQTSTRLIYRRYLRIVGDVRRYHAVGHSTVLAWKVFGGWAHPTGRARVVPFDRRFYSGGGASVRGWRLRELGPGAASFRQSAAINTAATNILGGDIKLEASAELRKPFLDSVLGASWIATVFTDIGNVWFGPRNPGFPNIEPGTPNGRFVVRRFIKELGVGSGFGLRVSWEYLVMRLDFAYRVYDPAASELGFLPYGLRHPTPYFGIGHTF